MKQEFAVLRSFTNAGEAVVIKSLLDSAGIDNFIRNDAASNIGLPMLNEGVGIELVVRTADLPCAKEFLDAQISPTK
ncbi:MAG: DUF2007 domain-containing protein [Rikenellaceae bacterium]|jgi:hypothetical protein|nr:DUF2007 domain-containing protein [Rikenellaceae bacterium]